jgi:hypothetical protein
VQVLRRGSAANNKPDGEEVAVTDNGNYIVDLHFERPLTDAHATAAEILQVCRGARLVARQPRARHWQPRMCGCVHAFACVVGVHAHTGDRCGRARAVLRHGELHDRGRQRWRARVIAPEEAKGGLTWLGWAGADGSSCGLRCVAD